MSTAVLNAVIVSDSPPRDDAELVERFIVARDQAAFAELVHRHSGVVLGVCHRVLHDTHDIEDVFQATFLVFVRDANRVRKRKSLASWLYGVAYRLSLRVVRQKRKRREIGLVDDNWTDDDSFEKMANQHDQQLFDRELNALPDRYRQPLVLRYLAGKSPGEVASELGITVGAVDGLLKRGKNELRTRLMRRGITLGTALIAVQFTQQAAEAAGSNALVHATIQAGLAWNTMTNSPPSDLVSHRALELAKKEMIAMTTVTKATIAVGLTLGGLVAGLSGVSGWTDRSSGTADAAGIVSTIATHRTAIETVDLVTATVDAPVSNPPVSNPPVSNPPVSNPPVSNPTVLNPTVENEVLDAKPPISKNATRTAELGLEQGKEKGSVNGTSLPQPQWDFKSRTDNIAKIESALESPTAMDFTDYPLKDALAYLRDLHRIEIWIDVAKLSDEGITTDQIVSLVVERIRLKDALRLLLDPLKLDYVLKNDVMVITTRADAEETLEARVYDLGKIPDYKPEELMEIIMATVSPDRWTIIPRETASSTNPVTTTNSSSPGTSEDASGLLGTIRVARNNLVIRQTQRIHAEIVDLLSQLK